MLLRVQNKQSLLEKIRSIKSPQRTGLQTGNSADRSISRNISPKKFDHIGYKSNNSKYRRNKEQEEIAYRN